jgi:signal transduction histidine kinase
LESGGIKHLLWLFARTLVGCLPLLCFFGLWGLGRFRSWEGAPIASYVTLGAVTWCLGQVLVMGFVILFDRVEHRLPMGSMWEPWLPTAAGLHLFVRGQLVQSPLALTHEESLRALRAQLQPHFLFNTLHAIGVTAKHDPDAAQRMTTLLGDLLRGSLVDRGGKLVSISEELTLLQPYLQLQQVRFQDRLRIETDVPPRLLVAQVPDLLLQPLVENAIEHGIEQRPGAGLVRIVARTEDGKLVVEVEDDGPGPEHEGEPKDVGTGLGATIQRIRLLFAAQAWLELRRNRQGGTTTQVRLPLQFVRAVV